MKSATLEHEHKIEDIRQRDTKTTKDKLCEFY